MTSTLALALLVVATSATSASPIEGEWKVVFPCTNATGVYAERCADGERDYFWLGLQANGASVCGFHIATGQMGNKVDGADEVAPTIAGSLIGAAGQVSFLNARGAKGTAVVRLSGDQLEWRVLQQSGTTWIPEHAVLTRQPTRSASRTCQPGRTAVGEGNG
ncbi:MULTISPECIES: hypothetical protein [unclassified Roseateles]|uniref:hypothetical protein n=1 Tax=unclassified Roseateles TaxID=2626991 RepID=UPI0006F26223|nr:MULTISPECIES: hypothetical protein [unclassified Roseateles]KQW44671.1 hypothetical protein ASC81_13855 [Pelomonas sp. Root405]KRA70030.1 hypothetical protein ASD88_18015 [Pelomonas sp. Root662]